MAIVTNAAMNMGVEISVLDAIFNLGGHPGVELQYHIIVRFLLCKGTIILFSMVTVPLYLFKPETLLELKMTRLTLSFLGTV